MTNQCQEAENGGRFLGGVALESEKKLYIYFLDYDMIPLSSFFVMRTKAEAISNDEKMSNKVYRYRCDWLCYVIITIM